MPRGRHTRARPGAAMALIAVSTLTVLATGIALLVAGMRPAAPSGTARRTGVQGGVGRLASAPTLSASRSGSRPPITAVAGKRAAAAPSPALDDPASASTVISPSGADRATSSPQPGAAAGSTAPRGSSSGSPVPAGAASTGASDPTPARTSSPSPQRSRSPRPTSPPPAPTPSLTPAPSVSPSLPVPLPSSLPSDPAASASGAASLSGSLTMSGSASAAPSSSTSRDDETSPPPSLPLSSTSAPLP